jgi:DNA modification methylase
MAINKQSFYESINQDTVFDEDFFKKVLGYSMFDVSFLDAVVAKLTRIGRKYIVDQYNAWYAAWKVEDDLQMKKIAEWFQKECDKQFDRIQKKHEKAVKEWKTADIWQTITETLNYRPT